MFYDILTWLILDFPFFKGLLEDLGSPVGGGLDKPHDIHPDNRSVVVVISRFG